MPCPIRGYRFVEKTIKNKIAAWRLPFANMFGRWNTLLAKADWGLQVIIPYLFERNLKAVDKTIPSLGKVQEGV